MPETSTPPPTQSAGPAATEAAVPSASSVGNPSTPVATITSTPELSGLAAQPLDTSLPLGITRIEMIDARTGWAIAPDKLGDDHLLYTQDGGQSWYDRTPPEPAGENAQNALAFFLDNQHAWIIYAGLPGNASTGDPARVWITTDGGRTWQAGGLAEFDTAAYQFGYPYYLTFIDPAHGWLSLNHGGAAGTLPSSLFKTEDGGQSWKLVKEPFIESDEGLDICCSTGLVFMDIANGLATKDPGPMARTYYVLTGDGGASWAFQEPAPADQDLFVNGGCTTRSPVALPPDGYLMAVDCFQPVVPGGPAPAYLYYSGDRGQTWEFYPLPDPRYDPTSAPVAYRQDDLFFKDPQQGWLVTQAAFNIPNSQEQQFSSFIYQTTNGGQAWTLSGELPGRWQFSFVDQANGWATSQDAGPALLATRDGGKTWQPLTPRLAP